MDSDSARSSLARELGLLLLALLYASLATTALAWVFTVTGLERPERNARKALVPFYLITWFWMVRPPRAQLAGFLGFLPTRGARSAILRGFLAGGASLLALNAFLYSMDARVLNVKDDVWKVPVVYIVGALFVATMEGVLFRGIMQRRFTEASGARVAIVFGSLIYSATHFLRPPDDSKPVAWWDTMLACFRGVGTIWTEGRWREAFGLFLVGLVLAIARERTGRLYLSIGIHAGWVFLQHAHRKTMDLVHPVVDAEQWWIGTQDNYDGLLGWIALLVSLGIALRLRER